MFCPVRESLPAGALIGFPSWRPKMISAEGRKSKAPRPVGTVGCPRRARREVPAGRPESARSAAVPRSPGGCGGAAWGELRSARRAPGAGVRPGVGKTARAAAEPKLVRSLGGGCGRGPERHGLSAGGLAGGAEPALVGSGEGGARGCWTRLSPSPGRLCGPGARAEWDSGEPIPPEQP